MRYSDATAATDWAIARRAEQMDAHDGGHLVGQARAVCMALPEGPLTLLTTSAEGSALAGAISVLRSAPTRWQVVHLGRRIEVDGPVAIVEAVELGSGIRDALRTRFPDAPVFAGVRPAVEMVSAA